MSKAYKHRKLSQSDLQALKYQCRPGILFPAFILILGVAYLLIYNYVSANQLAVFINAGNIYVFLALLAVAGLIAYLIMRKYLLDIRNGEKIIEFKQLTKKETVLSHEAGSGSVAVWQKMKDLNLYNLIIEGKRYKVSKQLFDVCHEGDFVEFHIAPRSGFRLQIQATSKRL